MKLLSALFTSLVLLWSASAHSERASAEAMDFVLQDIVPGGFDPTRFEYSSMFPVFSPDGRLLAIKSEMKILLIDLQSGRVLRRLSGFTEQAICFDFSRDGKRLLAVGNNSGLQKSNVVSFETETGKILRRVEVERAATYGCALSPDSKRFAITIDAKLEIRDTETLDMIARKEFSETERQGYTSGLVKRFVYLADGKTIVGVGNKYLRVIDTDLMQVIKTEPVPGYPWEGQPQVDADLSRVMFTTSAEDNRVSIVMFDSKTMSSTSLGFGATKFRDSGLVTTNGSTSIWLATRQPAVLSEFDLDGKQRQQIEVASGIAWSLFDGRHARVVSYAKGGSISQIDLRTGLPTMLGRYRDASRKRLKGFIPETHALSIDTTTQNSILDLDAAQSPRTFPRTAEPGLHIKNIFALNIDGKSSQIRVENFDTESGQMLRAIDLENGPQISFSSVHGIYVYPNELQDLLTPVSKTFHVSTDGKYLFALRDNESSSGNFIGMWSLDTGKLLRRIETPQKILRFSLAADGKTLIACSKHKIASQFGQSTLLQSIDVTTGKILVERIAFSDSSTGYGGTATTMPIIDTAGRFVLLNGGVSTELVDMVNGSTLIEYGAGGRRASGIFGALTRNGDSFLIAHEDGQIVTYDLTRATPPVSSYQEINQDVLSAPSSTIRLKHPIVNELVTSDDGLLGAGKTAEGSFTIFNRKTGAEISLVLDDEDWLLYDDEGNFDGSKGGTQLIGVTDKLRPISIDQFAVSRNRPDMLMKHIGVGAPEMLSFFRKQHDLRLKRMRLTEQDIALSKQPPHTEILTQEQKDNELHLRFKCEAPQGSLRTAQVFVNDVPFYSGSGKIISGSKVSLDEKILLGDGFNKIETSCSNDSGIESFRALTSATATPKQAPDLYVLAFGVSKYTTPGLELAYAAKDADDFAAGFDKLTGYSNVHTKVFLDEKVNGQNLAEAKALVAKASPSDVVAVFFAGHGSHDDDPDQTYYLLTAASNADNLAKTGLPFSSMEELLKSTPARKRLMFIDACESGEVEEPAAVIAVASDKMKSRAIKRVKQVGNAPTVSPDWTRALLFAQDRIIFNDFRRRSGAFVFSSSRGGESSYEDSIIKNGYFTAALLQGLNDPAADKDGDQSVSLKELQRYVSQAVAERSKGAQHPTVDRDNLSLQLWLHGKNEP